MSTDLTDLSAAELSQAIRTKKVSCVDVMQAYLAKINKFNPVYNAIVGMADEADLLDQAKASDEALARNTWRGWLHGVPFAVKDLEPAAGLLFTSGSPIFDGWMEKEDSTAVARIRAQGAIIIGKTNVPEFGLGSQSYNPVFGPTGNAYDPSLTSGGSSGGAACALATHLLPIADGSDMMGSLRNPAAFNNVIGFRPSTNVITEGLLEPERPLSTLGPMGRNTADTIRLLQTMADTPLPGPFRPLGLNEVKIGWMGELDGYLPMEAGILELCATNLRQLVDAGAKVEPVLPKSSFEELWRCWTTLRSNKHTEMRYLYEEPQTLKLLKPEVVWEIERGLKLNTEELGIARAIRSTWYDELDKLFAEFDFLALPSAQVFPFSKTVHWPKQIAGRTMDTYHRWMEVVVPASLGGIPVINLPVGFDAQGRPMGMQIMGKYGDDKRVLELGLAYEQITNHLGRLPRLVCAGEIR